MSENINDLMEKIVSLCKRRGFVFSAGEIYGGLSGSYSYGPYGVTLKNKIKKQWWDRFVSSRDEVYGLDGPIILPSRLWEASGHIGGFNDAMVDCKKCRKRWRADHLVVEATGQDLEGDLDALNKALLEIPCPACGAKKWSAARFFNMMFKTEMNGVDDSVYLRPETAGAIFAEFKNIVDVMRPKLPFGVAQIGKAFRNEIIVGNFIFRTREFEQMELEYFIDPEKDWQPIFSELLKEQENFFIDDLGINPEKIRQYEHPKEKLSHYSQKTIDLEYDMPFGGFKELCGLAHRGDFDLKQHSQFSNEKLEYFDVASNRRLTPHVLEPSFGLDRCFLVVLLSAYCEEKISEKETRVVLRLPVNLAPVTIAVFPLLKNKPELVAAARKVYENLRLNFSCEFDDNGNVGKRYRRQDEIGTPFCVTLDFDSLDDDSVTVRDRDTMTQERIKILELEKYFFERLKK
ncbi:MAG: glycine--tRNA ligase [Patescibacteria group bacterium]|jgi:glycyl-tRNA synthetase|nr:glycine--tRNA ligase [Patescibacteria group bacterium]MDD3435190.1 glycine--tRNA ligase [Patescibacteria group bacterium]